MDHHRLARLLQVEEIFQGILYENVSVLHIYRKSCQRCRVLFRVHEYAYFLAIIKQHANDRVPNLSCRAGY